MPYLNEMSCRLYDPKEYVKGSFRRKTVRSRKKGKRPIGVVTARRSARGPMELQSLRFSKDEWSKAEVKQICRDNYGTFEDVRGNPPKITKKRIQGLEALLQTAERLYGPRSENYLNVHAALYEARKTLESQKAKKKNPPARVIRKASTRVRRGKLPKGRVLIYDRTLAIEAVKSKGSHFAKEKFRHDFTRKGSKVYGLPSGDLLIRGKAPLHKMFEYDERDTTRGK